MTTKTNTARKLRNCLCQAFEFGEFDGENENAVIYDTNCSRTTHNMFAQGHDAKLVGFLVRAELAGEEIRVVDGGVATYLPGAVDAAARVSDALALKAQAQLDAAKARLAKKAAREAAKTAKASKKAATPTAPKPTTREAFIKVGRWTHRATIDLATGTATWTSKTLGATKTAEAGQYKEV